MRGPPGIRRDCALQCLKRALPSLCDRDVPAGGKLPAIIEGLEETCGLREASLSSLSLGPRPSNCGPRPGRERAQASGCGSISSASAVPSSGHARCISSASTNAVFRSSMACNCSEVCSVPLKYQSHGDLHVHNGDVVTGESHGPHLTGEIDR